MNLKPILFGLFCTLSTLKGESPNVILINADDLGLGLLGCYGQELIETPNIDRLAKEGMKFNNYYGATFCAPSRWSLLTGMHFGRQGAWKHNGPGILIRTDHQGLDDKTQQKKLNQYLEKTATPIVEGEVFLAQIAKQANYTTAQFDKLNAAFMTNHKRISRFGWDHYLGYYSHSRAHGFYPPYLWQNGKKVRYEGNPDIRCGKMSEEGNEPVGSGGKVYSEHLFIKEALDFITTHREKPFFLYYATQLPHGPVAIPELHASVKDNENLSLAEKKFASMVIMLDDHVGLIMAQLKKLNLDKNTIVFFTADNGHELYYGPKKTFPKTLADGKPANLTDRKWRTSEAGDVFDGAAGRAGIKRAPFQGGIQCPMIARWPGKIEAGSENNLLSSHYDFMATLAELTEQTTPEGKDSLSYLPTLLGQKQSHSHDYIIFDNGFNRMGKTAIIGKDGWKLVEIARNADHFQLYNLNDDPAERHDLAEEHPDKMSSLKQVLLKELKSPRPDLELLSTSP